MTGFHTACVVAAGISLAGAAGALLLPGRTRPATVQAPAPQAEAVPA